MAYTVTYKRRTQSGKMTTVRRRVAGNRPAGNGGTTATRRPKQPAKKSYNIGFRNVADVKLGKQLGISPQALAKGRKMGVIRDPQRSLKGQVQAKFAVVDRAKYNAKRKVSTAVSIAKFHSPTTSRNERKQMIRKTLPLTDYTIVKGRNEMPFTGDTNYVIKDGKRTTTLVVPTNRLRKNTYGAQLLARDKMVRDVLKTTGIGGAIKKYRRAQKIAGTLGKIRDALTF